MVILLLNWEFQMAPAYFFVFFALSNLVLLHSVEEEIRYDTQCPPFQHVVIGKIGFLFIKSTLDPETDCRRFAWHICGEPVQRFQLESGEKLYDVLSIHPADTVDVLDTWFHERFPSCKYKNFTSPIPPLISFKSTPSLTLLACVRNLKIIAHPYYSYPKVSPLPQCRSIHLNMKRPNATNYDLFSQTNVNISFQVQVSGDCRMCYFKEGKCQSYVDGKPQCANAGNKKRLALELGLALGIGCPAFLMLCFVFFFLWRRSKQKRASSDYLSRNISSDPSKSELESGSIYFGVPIFSYSELVQATNNFDPNKELGDGGFGTVFHGKLRDGREVAVKRLYKNNCRRVEQFMNEVEILTRLRHKNLVSLYGCTSRHSRELLLVYEFIPNGTVADHLHGDQPKPSSLTWPIRMSIALETANALAYLHASDIIHRDVKTNNILLDNYFCVKVADFGLSRLFPTDVSHVSTAPAGTPGYVDPDYHQCYQLTNKSDVYSFGVVLIELISSLPAVDISRHRHEINLADLAINKIQSNAFSELVDPCLGFESNLTVKRMTTSVAELAFRCLQHDKEMRPSMNEVLEVLQGIESEYEEDGGGGMMLGC